MRTRKTLTISMPPAMVAQVKKVSEEEYRTPSELIREALRSYFITRVPISFVTASEKKAILAGRAAYGRGEFKNLNQTLHDLDSNNYKTSRKGTK